MIEKLNDINNNYIIIIIRRIINTLNHYKKHAFLGWGEGAGRRLLPDFQYPPLYTGLKISLVRTDILSVMCQS